MASTRDLRRRIKSIKNTSQITKAMQMVAASKMRKAQQAALSGRPYGTVLNSVLGEVTGSIGDFRHPLLGGEHHSGKHLVILISTDRGLCGGLNGNLMREASKFDKDSTLYICAGRKASQFIARTKRQLVAEFTYKDTPKFDEARVIAKCAADLFIKGEVDSVEVIYTKFVSTLVQKADTLRLLPIGDVKAEGAGASAAGANEYLFEPSAEDVLGALLPHYVNFKVYQMLLEAKASEHSARMVAMKSATDNAVQLVKDLTLEYNKVRQAAITKELLEIATAQMAMG